MDLFLAESNPNTFSSLIFFPFLEKMGSMMKEERIEEESKEAILYVNGVRRVLPDGLAHLTLLEYLRG